MITIGQLADYAGVTIKAVRHYHERGLLAEPPRDSSGYRRYSAQHAIDLVKIKTLAEAGVPLARINELLAADPDRFAAAITEIDRNLAERADEILRTRKRIAQLSAGDRLFVSAEVADYLDRLHELGVSQRTVQMERDIWILLQSVSPQRGGHLDRRQARRDRRSGVPRYLPRVRRGVRLVPGRPASVRAGRSHRAVDGQPVRQVRGQTGAAPGPGHRPAGDDVGRRVVAGLGPARRDRQAAPGRPVTERGHVPVARELAGLHQRAVHLGQARRAGARRRSPGLMCPLIGARADRQGAE